jgi:predicted GIY-YIG superfamily endonuclease
MASHIPTFHVYILELIDGSYYVGHTNNLKRRMQEHSLGIACSHTKKYPMKELRWSEIQPDRLAASKREKEIKGWKRVKKEMLWKCRACPDERREEGSRRPDHVKIARRL